MTKRRKICVVTGSRAEYGLLRGIMRCLEHDASVELQVIATGMHLSPEFGNTWQAITADGFTINRKVEMLLSSDTSLGMAKSAGIGLLGIADALGDLTPDLLVVLGDRFEILAAATAAALLRIPLAHIHGGEATEGAIDDTLRHAITKLAHLHMTSTETYRRRVIQMGESPDRVFLTGAPGIDAIAATEFLTSGDLSQALAFDLGEKFILVTFHPVTLGTASSTLEMDELLTALDSLPADIRILITLPNADAGGRELAACIRAFADDRPDRVAAFPSLGQLLYLSAMRHCLAVVGNSSSGIIEAPSLGIPTVNIGDRQKGRVRAQSVIDCAPRREAIRAAIERSISPDFRRKATDVPNPYGSAGASARIAAILAGHSLESLARKPFHDLP